MGLVAEPAFASIPHAEILERISSPYNGELTVVDSNGSRYLLASAIRGTLLQSSMSLSHKEALTSDYLRIMALMTGIHPKKDLNIFNLGLGGGNLPRFQLNTCKKCRIQSVEIDPTVIQIAKKYFNVTDPRHTILDGEGFRTLSARSEKFDVVWIDAALPKEGPRAYMKAEDLHSLRDHISPAGIIVTHLGSPRSENSFKEVENGFKRYYSHGIRIRIPAQDVTGTLAGLQPTVTSKNLEGHSLPAGHSLPDHLIAVGNSPTLSCKRFWAFYRQWRHKGYGLQKWETHSQAKLAEHCEELI